jgi:hypothetical protein
MSRNKDRKTDVSPLRSVPLQAAPRPRSPSGVGRDTLRVARAQRILAAELPRVIYQGRPERSRPSPDRTPPLSDVSRLDLAKRPSPPPRDRVEDRPNLRDKLDCNKRPADSRKSGGSGASRAFVPWDSKPCS